MSPTVGLIWASATVSRAGGSFIGTQYVQTLDRTSRSWWGRPRRSRLGSAPSPWPRPRARQQAPASPTPAAAAAGARDRPAGRSTRRSRRRRARPPAADAERRAQRARRGLPGARRPRPSPRARACSRGRPTAPPTASATATRPAAPIATAESPHFCVFWVSDPGFPDAPDLADANGIADGDGVPDYVEALLAIAEHSYAVEVAPGPLGWAPPKPDTEGCGADPSARSDIYLKQIGTDGPVRLRVAGPGPGAGRAASTATSCSTTTTRPRSSPASPTRRSRRASRSRTSSTTCCSRTTTASRTSGCSSRPRSGPRRRSIPQINDYLNYVRAFAQFPGRAAHRDLSARQAQVAEDLRLGGLEPLARRGRRRLRRRRDPPRLGGLRPDQAAPTSRSPPTTRAIAAAGGRSFSREFASFAAATAEWRTGCGNFPDHAEYPDVKRKRSLRRARTTTSRSSTRRTACFQVKPGPANASSTLRLRRRPRACGPRSGWSAATASPLDGRVTRKLRFLDHGGERHGEPVAPAALRADHRRGRQRRRPRPRLPRRRLGLQQGRGAVPGPGRR